jgi:ppGpp synthetase/RelA/SpoT-type nucleotidyltranferase
MGERTIEDRLREEYFELLPDIRRVTEHVEAEVKYFLLPISRHLDKYERLVVTSRIKECESALEALRRRQEGATFDRDRPDLYSLTSLNDLAGVRILAFPRSRLTEIDHEVRNRFAHWEADPVRGYNETDELLGFKYHGYCDASIKIRGELQIVSMLTGLFWEVEHSTIYKPTPSLKGVSRHPEMRKRTHEVLKALRAFEENFEKLIGQSHNNKDH